MDKTREVYEDLLRDVRVSYEEYTADNLNRLRVIVEEYLSLKKPSLGSGHEVKLFNVFISVRGNHEARYNEGWNPVRREFSMSWQRFSDLFVYTS